MHALGVAIGVLGAVALLALNVMYLRRYGRFVRYLELNHPEHWKSLGSPVQFEDEPRYGSFGYVAYFANRSYAELGDPELSMLGDKMRGQRKWMFASLGVLVVGIEIARRSLG